MEDKSHTWLSKDLYKVSELLFNYTMRFNDFKETLKDYGDGEQYTVIEVHTVTQIEECPGITITELAEITHRSKSAVSQIVTKLEKRGLVIRTKHISDAKKSLIFVTPKGREVSINHKNYDTIRVEKFLNESLKSFSTDETEIFFKVMKHHLNYILDIESPEE